MNNTKLTINREATVGEIVAQNYHAAGVFRQYGLDFCCGGGISLQKACEKHNIPTDDIVNDLMSIPWGESSPGENYRAWEPDYLIDYIEEKHHRFVRTKTDEIAGYAAKVARVHGECHPENIEIYKKFVHLSHELLNHMEEEEKVVFPLIKKMHSARINGQAVDEELKEELRRQLERMTGDHEGAGEVMDSIRGLSNNFTSPADACTTYQILYYNLEGFESDLHKHVHLENNILFKKAEKYL